jgi:hypothetical protein
VNFSYNASGGAKPYIFHWDFGDGDTSSLQNPEHVYDDSSQYIAVLTIADACADVSCTGTSPGAGWGMILEILQGGIGSDQIRVGEVEFGIRMIVPDTMDAILGQTNGFRIYSPNGATWQPALYGSTYYGKWNESLPWDSWYDLVLDITYFDGGSLGQGADTVGFGGAALFGSGVPPGLDEVAFTISFTTDVGDLGKTICVDSSFFPPGGEWLWSTSAGTVIPEWSGARCFIISSGKATTRSDGDHMGGCLRWSRRTRTYADHGIPP